MGVAQDLIQGKLNRRQAEEEMENLHFHNTRKSQSGGNRRSPPCSPATSEEPEEPEELDEPEEQTNVDYRKPDMSLVSLPGL